MTIDLASEEFDPWYEAVNANIPLTQGDIILDCPIIRWSSNISPLETREGLALQSLIEAAKADVIVMTQACDLEQNKVSNVVVCPHISLEKYEEYWQTSMKRMNHKPTSKAWKRTCEDIKNGYVWNLSMLNESNIENINIAHRVVDFHDIFTLPRNFLESLLQNRQESRLRLRPPYREHLSQAFARFFMRVGLPTGIRKTW